MFLMFIILTNPLNLYDLKGFKFTKRKTLFFLAGTPYKIFGFF
jgi:hypothetical protein